MTAAASGLGVLPKEFPGAFRGVQAARHGYRADRCMNMVRFSPVSHEPLREDPRERWEEEEGTHGILRRHRNREDMEIEVRFSFNPFAGMDFEIDFEEVGMLMYSRPY